MAPVFTGFDAVYLHGANTEPIADLFAGTDRRLDFYRFSLRKLPSPMCLTVAHGSMPVLIGMVARLGVPTEIGEFVIIARAIPMRRFLPIRTRSNKC
jgi:hypothetical protein